LAHRGVQEWRRYLLRFRVTDVQGAGRETWYQRSPAAERQNIRIGTRLWRVGWRFEGDGRFGHGSDRGRAAPAGDGMAQRKPEHRALLVGCGQSRHAGSAGTHQLGGTRH